MPFGLTLTGFIKKPLATIVEELQANQRLNVDPSLTYGSEEPLTQLNGTFAEQLAQVWELGEILAAIDPTGAAGFRLDQIAQITGTHRDAATFSEVAMDCTFTGVAILLAGVARVRHDTFPEIEFVAKEDFTSAGAGTESVVFIATVAGPVQAAAGLITTIVTPVAGWTAAINPLDAVAGSVRENDSELKEKREIELASGGGASFPTLLSKLSKVEGVESVLLINNRTNVTDPDGVPAHSVEAVVQGGFPPSLAEDEALAQALFDNASAGTGFFGNVSVVVEDSNGNDHTIQFSRPQTVPIWITYNLDVEAGYIGETAHAALIAALDSDMGPGDDVRVFKLACDAIEGVPGVVAPTGVSVGLSFGSQFPIDIPILPREIADYDTARIVVNATVV